MSTIFPATPTWRPDRIRGALRRSLGIAALLHLPASAVNRYVDCGIPTARDTGDGSIDRPYGTLARAARSLQAADTCFIRAGTCRETLAPAASGAPAAPIRFRPYPGEKVLISGADEIQGPWQAEGNGFFSYAFPRKGAAARVYQVFLDGDPMAENTWPSWDAGFYTAHLRTIRSATREGPLRWCLADPQLPGISRNGYWKGAHLWVLLGVKTTAHILPVADHKDGRVCFDHWSDDPAYHPVSKDGLLGYYTLLKRPSDHALLERGQWSYDPGAGKLRIRLARGASPSRRRVEARTRLLGLDFGNGGKPLRHVAVSGVDFFAAGADFGSAETCTLSHARFTYVTPFLPSPPPPNLLLQSMNLPSPEWRGINLSGRGNAFLHSSVDGSWADGITLSGAGNTAQAVVVTRTNWMAGSFAGISLWGEGNAALGNTVSGTGRDGIYHHLARGARISHNRILDFGKSTDDYGGTYTVATDGAGTEISYNRIGPAADPAGRFPGEDTASLKAKINGIYLDYADTNFHIHHNAVFVRYQGYSLRMNGNQKKIRIRDNILLDAWGAIASMNGAPETMQEVEIAGNIMPRGFSRSDAAGNMAWIRDIRAAGNDSRPFETVCPGGCRSLDSALPALPVAPATAP